MNPPYLLDVNALLALAWPNHQFHNSATTWFKSSAPAGWATCAVTELGFVRLSSNPAYTAAAVAPAQAVELLARLRQHPAHEEVTCPTLVGLADLALALGHKQVTDAYLAALARHADCQLATFDRRLQALDPARVLVIPTA